MRPRNSLLLVLLLATIVVGSIGPKPALAETLARCGQGWLERHEDALVLHLKGSPYEMGWQHGTLLKGHIRENVRYLLDVKGMKKVAVGPLNIDPVAAVVAIAKSQERFTPQSYREELAGLAAGSGVSIDRIVASNYIPELFHCSGFALMGSATSDGTLYHGRVLDYAVDWQLQKHAVVLVCEPEGAIPFVNVTYAGFIGSVTGMNAAGISIGEMGGGGRGHWQGVPMAVLVREALERAHSLDEALAVFRDQPRTCEYYYVIADGKTNEAVGVATSWKDFSTVKPGESDPRLPTTVVDAVLLSVGARYEELARRALAGHGAFTAESALRLMDCPVAMKSNLHNVLFAPRSTKFWVANASDDGQPAASQPYHAYQLTALLAAKPDASAPLLAPPPAPRNDSASESAKR